MAPLLQQLMTGQSRLRPGHGTIVIKFSIGRDNMIEPLLCGIVLGLIPVTLLGKGKAELSVRLPFLADCAALSFNVSSSRSTASLTTSNTISCAAVLTLL